MSCGTAFKLDVIYNSIKESQYEKTRNEKRLAEAKQSRINMEHRYETVTCKLVQLNEIHNKMLKTLKVGQFKVMQTQSQIDSQEAINGEIRMKINKLENLIEQEQKKQESQREEYEHKLSFLEQLYREANQIYKEDSLLLELSEIMKTKDNLTEKLEVSDADTQELRKLIEGLKLKEDEQEDEEVINEEKQIFLHKMFQADLQSKRSELETLQKIRCETEQELNLLTEWKPPSDLQFVLNDHFTPPEHPSLQV